MVDIAIQKEQKAELHKKLWEMANNLRGNMEAYEFKNYILSLIFYRYLSEQSENYMKELLKDDDISYSEAWKNEQLKNGLKRASLHSLGYVIEPQYLFSHVIKLIETGDFDIEYMEKIINSISESTQGHDSQEDFEGLWEDMDLRSSKLGKEVSHRSKLIAKILNTINTIDFH